MKIKSKFKDYYDYVEHLHGGDPKIVYNRVALAEPKEAFTGSGLMLKSLVIKDPGKITHYLPNSAYHEDLVYEFAWLVFAGRLVPLMRKGFLEGFNKTLPWGLDDIDKFVIVTNKTTLEQFKGIPSFKHCLDWVRTYRVSNISTLPVQNSVVELSREVGHPIFIITERSYEGIAINARCPHLGELGFPMIYDANQLYQDLSYFIGNLMHESPDLSPPSSMTDKERILQHGFDYKQSFRHRT